MFTLKHSNNVPRTFHKVRSVFLPAFFYYTQERPRRPKHKGTKQTFLIQNLAKCFTAFFNDVATALSQDEAKGQTRRDVVKGNVKMTGCRN